MIGRLNHVAIVVPDLAAAAARYRDLLGATVHHARDLPEHGVTVVFVELPNSKIELMTPLGANSPVAKFLADHPGGAHGLPVLFLHPKDFDGTLIELEEVKPQMQPA